jgi:hypothetical protein
MPPSPPADTNAAASPKLPAFPSAVSPATPPAADNPSSPAAVPAPAGGKQSSSETSPATTIPSSANEIAMTPAPVTPSSSVVRTVSGEGDVKPAPAAVPSPSEPAAKAEIPHQPQKSLTERAKETWRLWFGD